VVTVLPPGEGLGWSPSLMEPKPEPYRNELEAQMNKPPSGAGFLARDE
jgi:hypothetical protein